MLSVLLVSGCGASSSTSSRSGTSTQSAGQTPPDVASQSGVLGSTSSATTTTTATSTTTPKAAKGSSRTSPPAPKGARIPATFKIAAGGALTPPTISAPSGYTVAVTLANRDTRTHTVVIKTPSPSAPIHVPGGGYSYLLETKLPKGSYTITVDGAARGALVVGSSPGP